MQPQTGVLASVGTAMANLDKFKITDPGTAAATCNYSYLITTDFTKGPSLDINALDLGAAADPGISDPIDIAYGAQNESVDPVNGDLLVEMKPKDVGLFRWESQGNDPTPFPLVVYGYCVCNHALNELLLVEKFPTPITITAVNQAIVIPSLTMRVPKNSFS